MDAKGVGDGDDGGWRDKARGLFRRRSATREGEGGGRAVAEEKEEEAKEGEGEEGEKETKEDAVVAAGRRVAREVEVVEPWIDVSPACPAGRERLRPDVLSLPLLFSHSLSLSLLSVSCSFPL